MPVKLCYQPSFERSVKKLDPSQQRIVGLILEALTVYYASGFNLEEAAKIAPHFFYKQLRKPYHEVGIERNLRIITCHDGERITAILAGNHNQIKQFLSRV